MGDFIGHAFKLVVIYFVFYCLSVAVFGGAACMGCLALLKAGGDWSRKEEAAMAAASASAASSVAVKAPVKPVSSTQKSVRKVK